MAAMAAPMRSTGDIAAPKDRSSGWSTGLPPWCMAGEKMHGAFDEQSTAVPGELPSRIPPPITNPGTTCLAVPFSPDSVATSSPPVAANDEERENEAFLWGMTEEAAPSALPPAMWIDEGGDRRVDFSLCRQGSSCSNLLDDVDYEDVGNKRRRKVRSKPP
jgi:hypothetical protein